MISGKPAIILSATLAIAAASWLPLHVAEAASCGKLNQRPCTVFERIPSCDPGLYEDFGKGKCLKPKKKKKALNCGAKNQRPCLVTERIPSCNRGLVEDFGTNRCVAKAKLSCGAQGQRPCTLVERVPSCDKGLAEDFLANRCVAAGPDHLRRLAERALHDLRPLLRAAAAMVQCQSAPGRVETVRRMLQSRDQNLLHNWLRNDTCLRAMTDAARSGGYNTVTLGLGGGGSIGFGVNSELGVAVDVEHRRPARFFATLGYSGGVGAGVDVSMIVSFYKKSNVPGPSGFGGDSQGFVYSGAALGGGGAAIWYDYDGRLAGASAFGSVGAGGEVGVYNRVHTEVY